MTPLRKRMIDDMVAAGLAANTQASYIQAVRGLAKHTRRSPDTLSESEMRSYLIYLRDERGIAHGSFQPAHAALQFLCVRTLDRDWALFSKKRSKPPSASACPAFSPMPKPGRSSAEFGGPSPGSPFC
jgi:hypothetical protein